MENADITTVLVVDDHDLIRKGVCDLLRKHFDNLELLEAGDLKTAKEVLSRQPGVDLVLLDVNLPDSNSLDGLSELKRISPATSIALISGITDQSFVRAALERGADGYIPKSADVNVIRNAVELLLNGEVFVPKVYFRPEVTSSPEISPDNAVRSVLTERLTPKQNEILVLVEEGMSNKEIARNLDCSESTVKTHVSAILSTINAPTRAKAVAMLALMR